MQAVTGDDVGQMIHEQARKSSDILIVSPYVTASGVELLLDALRYKRSCAVELVSRFDPVDVVCGLCDVPRCLDLMDWARRSERRGVELLRHPSVHAKAFVFDRRLAMVGSSNMTYSGLSGGNWELGIALRGAKAVSEIRGRISDELMPASRAMERAELEALADATQRVAQRFQSMTQELSRALALQPLRLARGDYLSAFKAIVRKAKRKDGLSAGELGELLASVPRGSEEDEGPEHAADPVRKATFLAYIGALRTAESGRGNCWRATEEGVAMAANPTLLYKRLRLPYPCLDDFLTALRRGVWVGYGDLAEALGMTTGERKPDYDRLSPITRWLSATGQIRVRQRGKRKLFWRE